ncbi:hypothetical protein PRZ48_011175 [Zasmidium cellare]|uniref:Uncharacterized protein n=1 Tax=Zasmidium cellare TaxID=395010 RepID=A0ABR0EAM8_ZASCE|nr:hypothetical protein PRZ48_011175 [Zasmidium cellare]
MRTSQAHIAGVGLSAGQGSNDSLDKVTISAATKALLDAGVTYGEVDECFACFHNGLRIPPSSFDTLGTVVIAAVIVGDVFLTSHAYLKDGAISILGAALVNRFHSRTTGREDDQRKIKTAVTAVLSQARIGPKDIQALELIGSGINRDSLKAVGDVNGKSSAKTPVASNTTTGSEDGRVTPTFKFEMLCNLRRIQLES